MKANVELNLHTREVYQLFERKINDNQLFIPAILRKFDRAMQGCNQQDPQSLMLYKQIELKIQELTQQIRTDTTKFELFLKKKKIFDSSKVNFRIQFRATITVNTPLCMQLIELIDRYDKFVIVLKLLCLAGCFETDAIYFANVTRVQKLMNRTLSRIMLDC